MRSPLVFVVSAAALAMTTGAAPAATSPLVVQTKSGPISGILVGAEKEWRGVPYAAPPVGQLRWRAPAPAPSWSQVREASQFATNCTQYFREPQIVFGAEDCLYLNVFAPKAATAKSKLAVMVHLHPGGNFYGGPNEDAPAFTARNVVVVTLAYRLGVLGFAGHPSLTKSQGASGEYGLLDQLAALRWVHENIAAFGGDPSRVTLFGSSAGSFDTAALMASPLAQGLIARAAVQGISWWGLTGKYNTVGDAELRGLRLAKDAGCGNASDQIACLRALPAGVLVSSYTGPDDIAPTSGGTVLPKPVIDQVGRQTVPLLVGNDREEEAWNYLPLPEEETTEFFHRDMNGIFGETNADEAAALYPRSSYDLLLWAVITANSDAVHGCPTRRLANAVHAPVWRYLYTHRLDDPNWSELRSAHVLEDPLLWGYDVFGFDLQVSPAEQVFSGQLADYWTNFAKTGNPNGADLPAWPSYDPNSEATLSLGEGGTLANYHAEQCAFVDTIEPIPYPWSRGNGPGLDPMGFWRDHAMG